MNKICKECKQENEPEYNYCKNCGNKLDSDVKIKEENTAHNINYSKYSNPFGDIGVEEISAEELSLFIGKKSNDILPKFQKMELTNSKISWCWPVAILSLIFGPFGAAFWYFYRKMYKFALIFCGVGFLTNIILSILTFNDTNTIIDTIVNAFLSGNFNSAIYALESLNSIETTLTVLASTLSSIVKLVTTIFTGIFSFYFYKKHCLEKIRGYKFSQKDSRFYQFGITAIGGVSSGMLALGILIMVGSEYLISFVTALFSIFF